jgi:mRNA interferase RelE/StbE
VSYGLELRPEVKDDFKRLDKAVATRMLKKLQWLSEQGENIFHQPLSANLTGFYKLRVGDYRAIYKLELDERASESKNYQQDKSQPGKDKEPVAMGTEPQDKTEPSNKVVVYFVGHRRDIYKRLE